MFQKNWNPWPIIIGMAVAMVEFFERRILSTNPVMEVIHAGN